MKTIALHDAEMMNMKKMVREPGIAFICSLRLIAVTTLSVDA